MMGFSSLDDLINKTTNLAQTTEPVVVNKITGGVAYTAGRWYDMSNLGGSPVANDWAGTALAWRGCNELTGNGSRIFGVPLEGDVGPATKHLSIMGMLGQSATALGMIQWVDMQGYWPGINLNLATAQALTGTPALRYANGKGVRPYLVTTTAGGATAQNVTLSYTNDQAVAGRALGQTVSMTASSIVGHMAHTGIAANNYGPFLPLSGGDRGVQNVAQVQFTQAGGAGAAALVLGRPVGPMLPLAQALVLSERDLVNQLRSLPRLMDGACLVPLLFASAAVAAASGFVGYVQADWG